MKTIKNNKMKQNINKILVVVLLSLGIIVSCDKGDDFNEGFLDTFPTQDISSADVTRNTTNLMLAINGIHRALYQRYESQGQGGLGGLMLINDALGDDLVWNARGSGWYRNEYRWQVHRNENAANTRYPYRFYYIITRNANVIINGADLAEGPIDIRDGVKAQALFYRAFSLFQLVQLYGDRYVPGQTNSQPGVPIRLEADNEPLARSTVEEVYAQVNADLDLAISLFEGYTRPNKSHIDQSVARGLKARVALVQGNYPVAAQQASLARAGFNLMTPDTYLNAFNDLNNPEWMWGSAIIQDQTIFFANFGAYISRNFSSSFIRGNPFSINSTLYDMFPSSDVRTQLFDPTGNHDNLPDGVSLLNSFNRFPYTNQKFIAESNADSRMDVPYMRAAEMFLIEAEALSHTNENLARQVLFNFISARDSEYTLSTNTGQALRNEILNNRRFELWGEGFRFYDLKRLDLPLDRTGANHKNSETAGKFEEPAGTREWTWLIPLNELNSNPLVEQNPI